MQLFPPFVICDFNPVWLWKGLYCPLSVVGDSNTWNPSFLKKIPLVNTRNRLWKGNIIIVANTTVYGTNEKTLISFDNISKMLFHGSKERNTKINSLNISSFYQMQNLMKLLSAIKLIGVVFTKSFQQLKMIEKRNRQMEHIQL